MQAHKFLANSRERQPLIDHVKAIARVAKALAANIGADDQTQAAAYYAGLLHDIGKGTSAFQSMLTKATAATAEEAEQVSFAGPYHNEVGYAILKDSVGGQELLAALIPGTKAAVMHVRNAVATSVLWHHACRPGQQTVVVSSDDAADILGFVQLILADTAVDTSTLDFEAEAPYDFASVYRGPGGSRVNAIERVVRACLIAADHAVSCLDASSCTAIAGGADLHWYPTISALLTCHLDLSAVIPQPTTDRDRNQALCATTEGRLLQVNAPTGFGKTRIGVMRMLHRKRKSMWVCPRNTVAESVYANIRDEIAELGLDLSVELYLTSDRQAATANAPEVHCTSDIIVTNIDMLLKPQTDYRLPERLYISLSYDIVFDEFHEFAMHDSPLFAAFTDLVRARLVCADPSTVCLSATPANILEVDVDPAAITYLPARGQHFPAVHTLPYQVRLVRTRDTKDLPRMEDDVDVSQTMVMFNSIRNAQRHTGKSTRRILVHSKFTKADRAQRMTRLMDAFGRAGNATDEYVVTAPLLQAALNISFKAVHISSGGAEMDLQAARTNRFGERELGSVTYYDMHGNPGERAAVDSRWDSKLQRLWFDYLEARFGSVSTINLDAIYAVYNDFYVEHGSEVLVLLRKWREVGISRMPELAPRRFVKSKAANASVHASQATLRNPDGSYAYVVRTAVGDMWLNVDDAFSCDEREINKIAENEPWLTDTRETEKLVRDLGTAYKCLVKLPQGKRRLEFARDRGTPLPATQLRYDSDDGVVYADTVDFVVG